MNKLYSQLEKREKAVLEEYILLKGSSRVMKDIIRCVYYVNCQVMKTDE